MEHDDDPEKRIAELERAQGRPLAGRAVEQPAAQAPARTPTPASPTRCWLYPNVFRYQNEGVLGGFKAQQYAANSNQPLLAIDVGAEAIWVMDPHTNALIASSWRAQATAIPTTYVPSWTSAYGGTPWLNGLQGGHSRNMSVSPQMIVSMPSMPPLTIASLDTRSSFDDTGIGTLKAVAGFGKSIRRFEWRGDAKEVREPADYSVWAADWLTLVGAFGLNEFLADHT